MAAVVVPVLTHASIASVHIKYRTDAGGRRPCATRYTRAHSSVRPPRYGRLTCRISCCKDKQHARTARLSAAEPVAGCAARQPVGWLRWRLAESRPRDSAACCVRISYIIPTCVRVCMSMLVLVFCLYSDSRLHVNTSRVHALHTACMRWCYTDILVQPRASTDQCKHTRSCVCVQFA